MIKLVDFLLESNIIEGYNLVTPEELEAARLILKEETIELVDLCQFVKITTEAHGTTGLVRSVHGMDVRIGNFYPMKGGPRVVGKLRDILYLANNPPKTWDANVLAYEIHHEYETLHPFTDGNGRSGRLLWLYCMGGGDWLKKSPYNFLQMWYYQSLMNNGRQ